MIWGEISPDDYRAKCKKISTAIAEQKRRLSDLEQSDDINVATLDAASSGQINKLKPLDGLEALDRDTVEELIHTIQVCSDNRIEISWNFNADYQKILMLEDETEMQDTN